MKKRLVFAMATLVVLVLSAVTYAGTTGTGSITPTAGGVSGGGIAEVAFASSGLPSWTPIEGTSSGITAGDLYTIDTTGTTPYAGDLFGTLFIQNGDVVAGTYSYFNQLVTLHMLSTQVTGEAVGTGDTSTTVFLLDNAPVAPTTLTVYLGGVAQTEGASNDYTVNYKTGTITFNVAPGAVAITADYWYNDPATGTAYKQAATSSGEDIPDTLLSLTNGFVTFVVAGDTGGAKYKVVVEDGALYTIEDSGTLSPTYFLSIVQAS